MRSRITIYYDNYCPRCTQFSELVRHWDWLGKVEIRQLRNENDMEQAEGINRELAEKQMASFDGKWHYGYQTLFKIFQKIPLFWPFLPLFFILKITGWGQKIYIKFAINRKIIPLHCDEETCSL